MQQRPFVYLITDESIFRRRAALGDMLLRLLPEAAGGIAALHLRAKSIPETELLWQARQSKAILADFQIPLVLHAELAVARRCQLDGLQVSERQLSPDYVTAIEAEGLYWALSSHDETRLCEGMELGARYAFFSPVFSPLSKPEDRRVPLGVDRLQASAERFPGRVVALGGIEAERIRGWSSMPLAGVATMSTIGTAEDPLLAYATLAAAWAAAK